MNEKRKRLRPLILCLILAALLALGFVYREALRMICYSSVEAKNALSVDGWTGGKTYQNVRYSDATASDYLNLYVPDTENPPLLVLVHGGGFVTNDCESRQAQLMYQYFRDQGWACATVNYRLAQEAAFPAAVEDVKCALRYLRANAEAYGYDADRVAIWGESAGGYLAVMAGVTAEDEFNSLPFIGETEPVSARVDAIVDYYGAAILETKEERSAAFADLGVPAVVTELANLWLKSAMKDFPGLTGCEDAFIGRPLADMGAEERQIFQPLYYIQKNLAPGKGPAALIWHGDADITVPRTQSEALADTIQKVRGDAGLTFELWRNARHADEDFYRDASLERLRLWLEETVHG